MFIECDKNSNFQEKKEKKRKVMKKESDRYRRVDSSACINIFIFSSQFFFSRFFFVCRHDDGLSHQMIYNHIQGIVVIGITVETCIFDNCVSANVCLQIVYLDTIFAFCVFVADLSMK